MTTVETIQSKLLTLPPKAQEEVLHAVEEIEGRYNAEKPSTGSNGTVQKVHVLTAIAELAIDAGVADLAERHDYYAHGKLEE